MAITRSSKSQSRIDDFPTLKPSTKTSPTQAEIAKREQGSLPAASKKKNSESTAATSPAKKLKHDTKSTKQQHFSSDASNLAEPIMINRSPVLQLFSACVAQFQHPDLSWQECLNIGSAIAALCAVSKGKAIGMIEAKDKSEAEVNTKEDKKARALEQSTVVTVMGFPLPMKNEAVLLGGASKRANEAMLKGKFGQMYEETIKVMHDALESWKDDIEGLDKKAFHMYEKFRPTVPAGQSGWGRKGELHLAEVINTIKH